MKIEQLDDSPQILSNMVQIEQMAHISPWSEAILKSSFAKNYKVFGVMLDDDTLVGYAIFNYIFDQAELQNIAISPKEQGNGYGRFLLTYALKAMQDEGIHKIFLEVRASNYKAIQLYKSVGFLEDFIRKNYYHTKDMGHEDALCMSLDC